MPVLEDLPDPSGKRVLVRADLNVPLRPSPSGTYEIVDDFRIRAALPTIEWLVQRGARVTVCSHLGRPKGFADPPFSLEPVRRRMAELAPEVHVLENVRFHPEEEANDEAFVDELVGDFDLFVNDAFGVSHRSHASVVGPPSRLPSVAGRLLAREVEVLGSLLHSPAKPFCAVLGGAKVSDKLGVVRALMEKVEVLMIGGGMCFTFLAALGHEVGDSLVEADQVENCRDLLDSGRRLMIPTDVVALSPDGVLGSGQAGTGTIRQFGRTIAPGWKGVDIGPGTAAEFIDEISNARTVLWNGPMGVFEDPRFEAGTKAVARAVADCRGYTVVGGGDSAAALAAFGWEDEVDHLSTGGGASLELIEHGDLPGLAALRESAQRWGMARG
ncbi:MAG: phosphoglycerate kinase [Acidimicrobiales bacterium]